MTSLRATEGSEAINNVIPAKAGIQIVDPRLKHMRLCRSAAPLHSGMTLRVRLLRQCFDRCLAMTEG